jgi:hypothetical protein
MDVVGDDPPASSKRAGEARWQTQIPSNLACRALAAFGRVSRRRRLILHASFAAMHHSRERDGV